MDDRGLPAGAPAAFAARAPLRWAGGLATAAWGLLAWSSQAGNVSLECLLTTLAVAWITLAWALQRVQLRDTRTLVIFGMGFRLMAFAATPVMEDDHHRFLWDGYRFATTGTPYAEAPQARFGDDAVPSEFRRVLDHINHPDVPTVYGPVAEWAFRVSFLVAPARLWPWKLMLLGAELGIFAMLWPDLGAKGRVVLAWCPLAIFETGFNAHPDTLSIALIVAAWWLGQRSHPLTSGAAAGLAVAAKVFALLLLPFLLWRQKRRAWAGAAVTVLALYGPFWWRGSAADLAGLRAMAGDWEFNSSVFAVLAALASRETALAVGAGAFVTLWLVLFFRWLKTADETRTLPPGEWVYGGFLLVSATANPWYWLWLWPFVAARRSATGLCALAAVSLAYITGLNLGDATLGNFEHPGWLRPLEFGLIGVGALWDWRAQKIRPRA